MSPFLPLLLFLLIILNIPASLGDSETFEGCSSSFRCGPRFTAGYPFWGGGRPDYCGHPDLELICEDHQTPSIFINKVKYIVLGINNASQTLRMARADYQRGHCHPKHEDTALLSPLLQLSPNFEMLTFLYNCPPSTPPVKGRFTCSNDHGFVKPTAVHGPKEECAFGVNVPINKSYISTGLEDLSVVQQGLTEGFELRWNVSGIDCKECLKSNGSCGYCHQENHTLCFCRNQQSEMLTACPDLQEPPASSGYRKRSSISRIFVPLGAAIGVTITITVCIFLIIQRQKFNVNNLTSFWEKQSQKDQKVEAFLRSYGSLCPRRYKFYDIQKMTNFFSNKLGQGGFGEVYQGELCDGRLVAVKLLKESKGDGEEFINEVASISRTSHVNIVTFLGFCFEKKKRALVYEFMSNGSLDKYIYNHESLTCTNKLGWNTIYQIAVGIARGLEYLHRGCNTRIVHFDIKPHNILLDEDFCPKISDFGLSRLCKSKESIISTLGGRGTPGYIAPEVFNRNFGKVSHKSDVYSYGMMIIEMVGGRRNMEASGSQESEIYFADWIYKYTEPGNELHGVINEEEKELAKKMILVSLWCIQAFPSDRPSISKVVEMLEGSLEDLQIPPKPSLSSPPRSIRHSSSTLASESSMSALVIEKDPLTN